MTNVAEPSLQRHRRDPYRFGDAAELHLRPGTVGWSSQDLEDPAVRRLWDAGRFEIVDGVLTVMPPAFFAGGRCVDNLRFLLHTHCRANGIAWDSASEVEIKVADERVLRADAVFIFGQDKVRFEEDARRTGFSWDTRALVLGPSLIIESVSQGHEAHDRKSKRRWYAELGAKRYWIVDVFARSLECLAIDGTAFREEVVGQGDQIISVPSLQGLSIALKDVWGT